MGGGTPTDGLSVFSVSRLSSFLLDLTGRLLSADQRRFVPGLKYSMGLINQVTSRQKCKRVGRICVCKDPSMLGKVCCCVEVIYLRVSHVTQSCGPSHRPVEVWQIFSVRVEPSSWAGSHDWKGVWAGFEGSKMLPRQFPTGEIYKQKSTGAKK